MGAREGWRALRYRTRRPIPIAELDDRSGDVLVSGTARRADGPVSAPPSGRDCLLYARRIAESREMRRFDGRIETWGGRGGGRDGVPFVLDDGTGSVLVDPTGAGGGRVPVGVGLFVLAVTAVLVGPLGL